MGSYPSFSPRRRWPVGLIAGLCGSLALLLVGVLLLGSGSEPPPTPVPEEATDRPGPAHQPEPTPSAIAEVIAGQAQLRARDEELTARLESLAREDEAAVERVRQALAGRLDNVEAALTQVGEVAHRADTRTQAPADTAAIAALKAELHALKAAARPAPAASPRPAPKTAKAPPAPAPPFAVLAIERWGEEWQVSVAQGARIVFLGQGESLAGWTVAAIEPGAGTVRLHDPSGRRYTATATAPAP